MNLPVHFHLQSELALFSYISDVTVGSILGLVVAYLVYRSYYPPLQRLNSHLPYVSITPADTQIAYADQPVTPSSPAMYTKLDDILKTV